ncbi:hypothetical protein [Vibrio splendidus]|uniref:hypothetical protein n=1 Tax=Vibrio splendidus TaxID=29497 RepID=UPI000C840A4D|nr:hypothetical protein [Vibrio splendidus]PMG29956.1 hypothetical protein BCU95_01945 [Vibrio splendidus]
MNFPSIENWKWWHNLTAMGLIGLVIIFPILKNPSWISASVACLLFSIAGNTSTERVRAPETWKRHTKWKHTQIGWLFLLLGFIAMLVTVFLAVPYEAWVEVFET